MEGVLNRNLGREEQSAEVERGEQEEQSEVVAVVRHVVEEAVEQEEEECSRQTSE